MEPKRSVAGPAALERFQKLIDQLDFFVARFEFFVPMQCLRGRGDVRQTVIDQRKIVIN